MYDARTTTPTSSSKATKRRTRFGKIDRTIGDGMLIMLKPSKAPKLRREVLNLLQEEGEIVFSPFRVNLLRRIPSLHLPWRCRARKSLCIFGRGCETCVWDGNDSCELPLKEELARRPESHRLAFQTKKWSSAGSSSSSSKLAASPHSDEWLWRRAG